MNSVRKNICFTIYYGFHSFSEHWVFRNLLSAFPVLTVGFLWLLLLHLHILGFLIYWLVVIWHYWSLANFQIWDSVRSFCYVGNWEIMVKLFWWYEFTGIWWNCLLQLYSWLQIQRSRVRFPALSDFLRSSGSGTGSTQPREYNWGATWMEK
jgi:hypothetical protein